MAFVCKKGDIALGPTAFPMCWWAMPTLLVLLPINVRQDSEFTGAMLARSSSMFMLRVSMAPKSRVTLRVTFKRRRSRFLTSAFPTSEAKARGPYTPLNLLLSQHRQAFR